MSGLVSKREDSSNGQHAANVRDCAEHVEEVLQKMCNGILPLMDTDQNSTPSVETRQRVKVDPNSKRKNKTGSNT